MHSLKHTRTYFSILAAALCLTMAGCGSLKKTGDDIYPHDGYAQGDLGDVMHTSWFDFSVNSAYVTDEYEGYAPAAGNELLVAEITVRNTFDDDVPMFDDDFQAQWNDDADDAYSWPVEDAASYSDDVLPDEYTLPKDNGRATGLLLFEVPAGNDEFSISFQEYFEDDTTGDLFFVYFTAEDRR